MSVKLIVREFSLKNQRVTVGVEVQCRMVRPSARPPRIELVFRNDYDDRRMVLPCKSFLPQSGQEDNSLWVAKARYNYSLRSLFWYGSWEECRLHFDIVFDGRLYESAPFEMNLRKMDFSVQNAEDEGADAPEEEDVEEDPVGTNNPGSYEYDDREIRIRLEEPITIAPFVQPGRVQVLLAWILRFFNALFGLCFLPWFCIDSLAVIFLPTEKKDSQLGKYGFAGKFARYVMKRYLSFCRKRNPEDVKNSISMMIFRTSNAFHRNKKSILFLSSRRADMTGNFRFIYPYLKKNPQLKLDVWLNPVLFSQLSPWQVFSVSWKCGKAKMILLDDYSPYIRRFIISQETMVIQIWNSCGAFKISGFSRIGKSGGPKQKSRGHRDYRYCFVSSKKDAKYYAEGFAISEKKVVASGVPRTDLYLDDKEKENCLKKLYEEYPVLEGKKVILFAPTFRGKGKVDAYYDEDRFDPNKLMERLPGDYVLIIRHHPYVSMEYSIKKTLQDRILDLSSLPEIDELLLAADVLITDYSSIIYDASLLGIPMLFYAYDLEKYIHNRGFYFEYETRVPGKIVYTQEELIKAIIENDFDYEKVQPFCRESFDLLDGKASERVAAFIEALALGNDPYES